MANRVTQSIGTSAEDVTLADAMGNRLVVKNLDGAGYVSFVVGDTATLGGDGCAALAAAAGDFIEQALGRNKASNDVVISVIASSETLVYFELTEV